MHTSTTDFATIQHATSDDQLLALWLHDRPTHTPNAPTVPTSLASPPRSTNPSQA